MPILVKTTAFTVWCGAWDRLEYNMRIVDAHCHASMAWFEPVEMLIAEMDLNSVQHAILIQLHGQFDNTYQTECVARYPDRLVSVVAVDPTAPDPAREISRLKNSGARGIRLRFPQRESLDGFRAQWSAAADLGLPVSFSAGAADFASDESASLIAAFPNLPIVIEHLGTSTTRDRDGVRDDTRRRVLRLSRFPNVCIKIHGLGEFARRAIPVVEPFPFELPIPPRLREAYDAFGPERMMWGSNYPPVSLSEGYANALRLTIDQFPDLSDDQRSAIFGGTAARIFGIE